MSSYPTTAIPVDIASLLAGLRWRIRAYVLLEGLAAVVIWLGLTFWVGLALDYFPILVGASEMPRVARAVLLLAIAGVSAWIVWHWILRRVFVPLGNQSMALLLERRHKEFQDSLLTAVQLAESPEHAAQFNTEMLRHTNVEARQELPRVRLESVFNPVPLARNMSIAAALLISIVAFLVANPEAFGLWSSRLYALSDTPWPRKARIEVASITVSRPTTRADEALATHTAEFADGHVKVAKGSNVTLTVRANADYTVPETCSIVYRTDEGVSDRVYMVQQGTVGSDNFQYYVYDQKPLAGIYSSVHFDVIGFDHRVRDFHIDVVDSPAVVSAEVACVFPAYLVDEKNSLWLPRSEKLTPGKQLPYGTEVTLRLFTNKDLREATIVNVDQKNDVRKLSLAGAADPLLVEVPLGKLERNLTLDVNLLDTDGVQNERPYRVALVAVKDEAPKIDVVLHGIGTAITPIARVPAQGTITDDYAVARAWVEVQPAGGEAKKFPAELAAGGKLSAAVDFRDEMSAPSAPLALKPKDKLVVSVKAEDKFNLAGDANVGVSDRYELEVVTPEELLALLENRELGLRRRFEQAIEEMTALRDSLVRVRSPEGADTLARDPEEKLKPKEGAADPEDKPVDAATANERARAMRLLRVQRCRQQGLKSQQEVLGVAQGFDDIREELVNNRIDTEDRKQRLEQDIASPLRILGEKGFPELETQLTSLEQVLDDAQKSPALTNSAIAQSNKILAEMEAILQKMLEVETYNELVDIVRDLIKDQNRLIDDTRKQQAEDLLKGNSP